MEVDPDQQLRIMRRYGPTQHNLCRGVDLFRMVTGMLIYNRTPEVKVDGRLFVPTGQCLLTAGQDLPYRKCVIGAVAKQETYLVVPLRIIIRIDLLTLTAGEDRVEQGAYKYGVEGCQPVLFMVDKYI